MNEFKKAARWHNRPGSVLSIDWLDSSLTGLVIYELSSALGVCVRVCQSVSVYQYASEATNLLLATTHTHTDTNELKEKQPIEK